MSIRVRIEHGQGAGTTWRLTQPGVYVLGRAKSNSIQVLDMKVSKQHCEIHLGEDGTSAILHDLGSTHGAMVNGQPQNGDTPLKAGDELRLGLSILRVLSDGNADHDITPIAGRNVDAASVDTSSATPEASTLHSLPPDELVGKNLGGYLIERKIGAGGMGGVYLAEQVSLKRKVALKVLNERFGADSAFIDQFVNEARAAGALNHPNVVQVYDVGSGKGHHFFSMEVMPGGSIEDRVKAGDAEWKDALNWFIDAANALIFALKKEILHRDVKPDNLMLAEDGSAKLCDLGLAKKSENADLMAQGIIGTPHFISPEAIRRKPDVNHRTDLYSLGCSFFRILTGQNPYPGKTVKEILLGHLNKPVPRVRERTSDVPSDLDEVVFKLMQKDPDERFQTPEELLQALDKVRLRHGLEAHGIRPHSRKPMIIAAAVAVLAIGAGIFFAMKDPEQVVQEISDVDREKMRQAEIGRVRNLVDQARLEPPKKFLEWGQKVQERALVSGSDEWKKRYWLGEFIPGIQQSATDWKGTAEQWRADADKQKHEEAKDILAQGATFMDKQAGDAEALATKHKRYIEKRRTNEKRIASARTKADQELTAAINGHKAKVEEAIKAAEFERVLEAARLLERTTVEAVVTPFRGKTEAEVLLLEDKQVDEKVKEAFGTPAKDGSFKDYFGAAQLGKVRARLKNDHSKAMAAFKVGENSPLQPLIEALKGLREYLKKFPEKPDPRAGTIAFMLSGNRDQVVQAIRRVEGQRDQRIRNDYGGDQRAYQELIVKLFAPRTAGGNGNLRRLGFLDAGLSANGFADAAKTPEYKLVGGHWVRAANAMKQAFQRAVSTYPKGWSSTKYTYNDDKGREKTMPFKDVSADGFKLGRKTYTFADWRPEWLLDNLFLDQGKPRFAIEGDEMLGLATLAEMAANFDLARSTYEKYVTGLDGDAKASVQWRLKALDHEAQAAAMWRKAVETLEKIEQFIVAHDPNRIGPKDFEEKKDALFNKEKQFMKLLQEAMALKMKLQDDPALAATIWGASTRDGDPHPDAMFAGEELPKSATASDDKKTVRPRDGDKAGSDDAGTQPRKGDTPEDTKDDTAGPVKRPGGTTNPGEVKKGEEDGTPKKPEPNGPGGK